MAENEQNTVTEEDALVVAARKWLRISTTSQDEEISQVVDACLIDLSMGGVAVVSESDPVIQQAVQLYLKAQFGYDAKAQQFDMAYEHLKAALALCGDYNHEENNNGANS